MTGSLWTPPSFGELADDLDTLVWDREKHGRMRDAATADDEVTTELWTPDDQRELRKLGVDLRLGARKLNLPEVLRSFGLVVEVVPGWETRGDSTFNPGGVIGHHTAGAATGDRPSLAICTYGRSDLPGPLCQVFLSRSGTAIVVASGRANHAGTGGFRGLAGNSSVFGIEAESKGTEPNAWTPAQLVAYPKLVAALLSICGRDESWYCRHATWTPRKIDTVGLSDQWMRDRVRPILNGGAPAPAPTTQTEDDVFQLLQTKDTGRLYAVHPLKAFHISTPAAFYSMAACRSFKGQTDNTATAHVVLQTEVDQMLAELKQRPNLLTTPDA